QKNKVRQTMLHKEYYLAHTDEINRQRRIKRREKRKNYEESLRFKLGRLERDVQATGLMNQTPAYRRTECGA
ncbi:unnamed protein product, partial [marine sediment metagenome]